MLVVLLLFGQVFLPTGCLCQMRMGAHCTFVSFLLFRVFFTYQVCLERLL